MHTPIHRPHEKSHEKKQGRVTRRRDAELHCAGCGKRLPREAPQQRFCSRKCRQRAHYEKSVAEGRFNPGMRGSTGLPTHPPRSPLNDNGFSERKFGSTARIYGPRGVIERELIDGRSWQPATSPDGVTVYVAAPATRKGANK